MSIEYTKNKMHLKNDQKKTTFPIPHFREVKMRERGKKIKDHLQGLAEQSAMVAMK